MSDPNTPRDDAKRDSVHPAPPKDRTPADDSNQQSELSERLDQGLEETFPSSDPVSVKITK